MERVTRNDDGTITVRLDSAVKSGEGMIDKIVLRGEATVADLEVMDGAKGDVGKSLRLVAELSGLGLGTIRKVKAPDFARVAEVLSEILNGGPNAENPYPATGGTP